MSFYVYALIDPRSARPFYIGKGSGNRAISHIKIARSGRPTENPFKDAVLAKMLAENVIPRVVYLAWGLSEPDAYAFEERAIRWFGRRGKDPEGILTNILSEGRVPQNSGRTRFQKGNRPWNEGRSGYCLSTETREKMSASRIGKPSPTLGRKQTQEEKDKRAASMKGRQVSEETRRKIAESNRRSWRERHPS